MSYIPNVQAQTSEIGVNSYTATTGSLWAGNVFTGAGEQNDFNYVGVNLQTDEAGTLTFEFSQDGVNWSQYPVTEFTITSGINEVHGAWKGTRYVRPKFTGADGSRTYFRIRTMYSYSPISLSAPLNQTISDDSDATIVKAITAGQQPDGDYVNAVSDGTAFSTTSTLLSGATYTSPWTDTDGFNSISIFIKTDVASEIDGITIQFTDDVQAGVPLVRKTLNYTYEQKDIDRGYLEFTFPTELDGFRLLYTNNSDNQGSFFIQSDLRVNRSSDKYNTGGALVVGDFLTEVALGFVPNNSVSTKFGTISQIDTGDDPVTIWALADDTRTPRIDRKNFSSSADTIYVSSSDVGDTGITITTIINDSNNDLRTIETVISGQTPISIGSTGYDCNTAFVSGNDQTLAGDVYVTLGSDHTNGIPNDLNKVLAFIPQQSQRTQQATFRVPRNTKMIIDRVHSSIGAGGSQASAVVNLRVKPENGSWYILRPYNITTSFGIEREETIVLNAGTYVEFFIDVTGTNIDSTTFFRYQLINGNL